MFYLIMWEFSTVLLSLQSRRLKLKTETESPLLLKPELYRPTTVRCNMSIWIQKGRVSEQDVCLMRRYSSFFPSLSPNVCSLSCIFQCAGSLHLYRWPPIAKQDHASSGVQRLRPQKELKPKAAGEYFHGWGWKVRLRLGSHRDTGEGRRGREG